MFYIDKTVIKKIQQNRVANTLPSGNVLAIFNRYESAYALCLRLVFIKEKTNFQEKSLKIIKKEKKALSKKCQQIKKSKNKKNPRNKPDRHKNLKNIKNTTVITKRSKQKYVTHRQFQTFKKLEI